MGCCLLNLCAIPRPGALESRRRERDMLRPFLLLRPLCALSLLRPLCALFLVLLAPPSQGAAQFVFFGRNQFEAPAPAAAVPVIPAAQTPAEAGQQAAREGKAIGGGESFGNGFAPDGSAGLETIFFGQVKRNPKTNNSTTPAGGAVASEVLPTASPAAAITVATASATVTPPPPVRQVDDTIFFGQVTRPLRPDPTPPAAPPPVFAPSTTSSPPSSSSPAVALATAARASGGVADTIFFGQVTRAPRPSLPAAAGQVTAAAAAAFSTVAAAAFAPTTVPPVTTSAASTAPPALVRGTSAAKHAWEGRNYYLSWRTGQNNFEWAAGAAFCQSLGMRLISLDSPAKLTHFLDLVAAERPLYFWAGGELDAGAERLRWLSGGEEAVVRGAHPWSPTGKAGAPQPDGAGAAERCLAVQNNLFR